MIKRPDVKWSKVMDSCECLKHVMSRRCTKHGKGIYAGLHEISGTMLEEWDEFKDAVHNNDSKQAVEELWDIAVVAIFGIVSMEQKLEDKAKE